MSLTLATNRAARVVVGGGQEVGVVLEHRAAAGGVDDDRVELVGVERLRCSAGPGPGRAPRRPSDSGSRRSRPGRAGSRPRSRSAGARGPSRRWSRGTSRRPRSRGRAPPGPASGRSAAALPAAWRASPDSRGSIACIRRSVGGRSLRQARSARPGRAGRASGAGAPGPERGLDPAGVGEQVMEDQPLEQAGPGLGRRVLLDGDLERLDQLAVLDARRAGRLAGPAIEAELEVPADVGPHRQPAVGHGPHQVDPPARAVVLVAGLDVRRAARRAEAAVDAFLEVPVVDLPGQPVEVDAAASRSADSVFGRHTIHHETEASGPVSESDRISGSRDRRFRLSPTNRPGVHQPPAGSSACLTLAARTQSGRGSPQTRSRSFQSVGQRATIRLPPSRTASARRRSTSAAGLRRASSRPGRASGRSRCRRGPGRPSGRGRAARRSRTTRDGRQAGHAAERAELGRPGTRSGADQSRRRVVALADRQVGPAQLAPQAVDLPARPTAALSSRPMARTQPSAGKLDGSPTDCAADGFRSSSATGRVPRC